MNYWLMSIKWGSTGLYFNEEMKKEGIIAIGHYERPTQNLAKFKSMDKIRKVVKSITGQRYYKMFLFEMKVGDIVYIRGNNKDKKLGANIFGRCRITSDYIYDKKRFAKATKRSVADSFWHIREAEWDKNFIPVKNNNKNKATLFTGNNTLSKLELVDAKKFEKKHNLPPLWTATQEQSEY